MGWGKGHGRAAPLNLLRPGWDDFGLRAHTTHGAPTQAESGSGRRQSHAAEMTSSLVASSSFP